jgi:rare lipoprotein A
LPRPPIAGIIAVGMKLARKTGGGLLAAALVLLAAGCRARTAYFPEGDVQTGMASWYGAEFQGRLTSSKEVYDMNDLTAAHNTLPLGSRVMVTNLNSGKSVVVRINDRGPFVKSRVIDLSYAAALAIGIVGPGTAPVRIEVLKDVPLPLGKPTFSVQVGAFVEKANALALKDSLDKNFAGVCIEPFKTPRRTYYRVRVRTKSADEAREVARRLSRTGYTPIVCEGP